MATGTIVSSVMATTAEAGTFVLISERVRRSSTIVTSNRPPSDGYALFPNPVLAEGALDRLITAVPTLRWLRREDYLPTRLSNGSVINRSHSATKFKDSAVNKRAIPGNVTSHQAVVR